MKIKFIIVLFFLFFITACGPKKKLDVSNKPEFSHTIGLTFHALMKLKVRGYTLNLNGKREVDYVKLTPNTSTASSGNQTVFSGWLPSNTHFKIVGVLQSYYYSSDLYYSVKIIGDDKYNEYTVVIALSDSVKSSNLGLDSLAFKAKIFK